MVRPDPPGGRGSIRSARRGGHLAGPGAARGRGVRARAHPAAADPAALRPPGGGPTPGVPGQPLPWRGAVRRLLPRRLLDGGGRPQRLHGQLHARPPVVHRLPVHLLARRPAAAGALARPAGPHPLAAVGDAAGAAGRRRAARPQRRPPEPLVLAGPVRRRVPAAGRRADRAPRAPTLAAPAGHGRDHDDHGPARVELGDQWPLERRLAARHRVLAVRAGQHLDLGAGPARRRQGAPEQPAPRSRLRQRGLVPLLRAPPDGHRRARLRRRWMGPRSVAEVRDPLPGRVRPDPGAVRARRPPDEPDPLPVRHEADAGRGGADDLSARCRGRRPRPARSRTRRPPAGCGRAGRAW